MIIYYTFKMVSMMSSAMSFFNLSKSSVPKVEMTTTENGSLAYNGTGSACLDLFIKSVRGLAGEQLLSMMRKAWDENPETLLQIMYNTRDCRKGKGERALYFEMAIWLRTNYWETYKLNLANLVSLGRFKDLIDISCLVHSNKLENNKYELGVLASYIAKDCLCIMSDVKENLKNISLAAKWVPTRDNIATKPYNLTSKFINVILSLDYECNEEWVKFINVCKEKYGSKTGEFYRKEIYGPLRRYLNLVETTMSQNNWNEINFSSVPSKAMIKYRRAFKKRIPERLQEYLSKLTKGEAKINISGQTPYDLLHQIFSQNNYYDSDNQNDEVVEAQWTEMLKKSKEENQLRRTVSIVDVSGSMSGTPMEVAIAMGLFTSLIPDESDPFYRKLITFSSQPQFHTVKGDTLSSMISNVVKMKWGMNTDFNAVFKLILDMGTKLELTQEQMPERVIVYTDMQFDAASGKTNFDEIKSMYANSGYKMPQMVFWNLRASYSPAMPVTMDESGTAFLSGYSAELLRGLMDGDIDPIKIMMNVLKSYTVMVHPDDISS
jgi:hypothetical protein